MTSGECYVPKREERGYTPAVLVRVANKGVSVYGTWKNVRNFGRGEESSRTPIPRCMEKSGEVIDGKGVGSVPLQRKSAELPENKGVKWAYCS